MHQKNPFLAGTDAWKLSSVACGFSSIKIDYSDCPKSLISRKICFMHFSILKIIINFIYNGYRSFCCNHTCYCVNMVSVTPASRYITSATRFHRYESRYSMCIRGLIPRNFRNWQRQFRLRQKELLSERTEVDCVLYYMK